MIDPRSSAAVTELVRARWVNARAVVHTSRGLGPCGAHGPSWSVRPHLAPPVEPRDPRRVRSHLTFRTLTHPEGATA